MKLYTFEISLRESIAERSAPLGTKFKVVMEGDRGDDEGNWSATPDALQHLGQARGEWQTMTRWGEIWILTHNRGVIQALRGVQSGALLVMLKDVDALKWPLFVGQGGEAELQPNYLNSSIRWGSWRVVARGF